MTAEQAREIAEAIRQTGKVQSVSARQRGGEFALPTNPWEVEIWHVNARAGNRTLYKICEYAPTMTDAHVRAAIGQATKRDRAAFARIAAEREMAQE